MAPGRMNRGLIMVGAFAACLAAGPAWAQGRGAGVKAGVLLSTLTFEDTSLDLKRRAAPVGGAFVVLPLTGRFAIQPEFLYARKGASLEDGARTQDVELDYLEIPVLVRWRLPAGTYATAGPSIGVRLRAHSRTTFGGETDEIDLQDEIEPWDLGLSAGIGVTVWGRVSVEARYTHGLRNIDRGGGEDGVRVTTRAVALTAGFRLR
jgi:hypothetical protein